MKELYLSRKAISFSRLLKSEFTYFRKLTSSFYTMTSENNTDFNDFPFHFLEVEEIQIYKHYYPNNVLRLQIPMKNGQKNGIRKEYRENGEIYKETPYENGYKQGIQMTYHENGEIYMETPYEYDEVNGIQKMYYEYGQIYIEFPYENDERHGIQKIYYESGHIKKETQYENDLRHGIERFYSETGEIQYQRNWYFGNLVEPIQQIEFQQADLSLFELCSICLKDKEECINPVVLNCHETHIFCLECIQNWMQSQQKCPICRQSIE